MSTYKEFDEFEKIVNFKGEVKKRFDKQDNLLYIYNKSLYQNSILENAFLIGGF